MGRLQEEQAEMPPSMNAPARGIVSQPSMSASLMLADTRPVGSMIWTEHGQKIWVLAKVVSQANTMLIVRRETGEQAEVDLVRSTGNGGKGGVSVFRVARCVRSCPFILYVPTTSAMYCTSALTRSLCLLFFLDRCSLSHAHNSYVLLHD